MSAGAARALRLTAAVASLAVAALLAVAAEDARRWPERLRLGDIRFQSAPERARWHESSWAGAGAIRSLLGIDDDLAFRRVSVEFHRQRGSTGGAEDALGRLQARAQLETGLRAIERRDADALRRARAANMLGVMSFETAVASPRGTRALLERTLGEFRNAVRIDPREEEAKLNLELLLDLIAGGDVRATGARGGEGGPQSEEGGAGATGPGQGY